LLACALACGLLPFQTALLPAIPCKKPRKRNNEDHVKIEKEEKKEEDEEKEGEEDEERRREVQ
jgi:hypothetical protein